MGLLMPNKRQGKATYTSSLPGLSAHVLQTEGLGQRRVRASIREKQPVRLCFCWHRPAAWLQPCRCWLATLSVGLWNSKMVGKRLQGCLLLLLLLVTNASGSHPEAMVGKRRLLQTASSGMFCVAVQSADPAALQVGLNWACGPGHADCAAIQPGGQCYKPNNLPALASYAYNDYYRRNANTGATCSFNGTATTTSTDPSSGQCVFAGSSMAGGNSSGTPAASAPSGLSPPSSFTPGTGGFGNGSSFGSPTGTLVPLDGAESALAGARWALCALLLALPLFVVFL